MHAAAGKESTRRDTTSCPSPATLSTRILPMEPDMDHPCGSTCATKHTKCWRKHTNTRMVTKTFWTGGITMTNTANLCLILGGLRKVSCNATKSHWKTIPILQQEKKEVGTRNHGHSRWTQKVQGPLNQRSHFKQAKQTLQKTVPRVYGDQWQWKQTYSSRATCPTKARSTVWSPWRTLMSTWCFYRMARLSFFHNAIVFIFVITMATKQRHVVKVELGLMDIFIVERTVIFESFQMTDFNFACRTFKLLAIDGRRKQYTVRAHGFLMRILSACLSQLVVTVVQVDTIT